jgi:hypothetical protein
MRTCDRSLVTEVLATMSHPTGFGNLPFRIAAAAKLRHRQFKLCLQLFFVSKRYAWKHATHHKKFSYG